METNRTRDHSTENEKRFEPVAKQRPGNQVLRRRREPQRRLRMAPNIPGVLKFLKVIVTQTPFLPMFTALIVLWLLVSAGYYFAEHNANPVHVSSYGQDWGYMGHIRSYALLGHDHRQRDHLLRST